MCSEASPRRLSFSNDFSELQVLPLKRDVQCKDTMLHDSNSDFEFNTSRSNEFEPSSADELFSNGVILPIQMIQERKSHYTKLPPRPCSSSADKIKKETIKELLLDVSSVHEKKPHSKSFWGFSRSKSLNCDTKQSLICSLPLLSRSNSTGSVPNPKRKSKSSPSLHSSSSTLNLYPVQKSSSGKSYGGSYGNSLRISHVLNVPTPYVSKGGTNLFGLGSFLRSGKVKKNKK
ncbi:hypothetical protein TanjilG_22291 [Lupinus angustifolius]|uniref:Uncharacterized protein n=1 Tax=Lupinus angustifolius TaxID=3871 RepID=A0A1J7HB03_LUPAN|nr:PREDICTED: uncharacterized protein LOC109357867 [Lupinus angustifolius]OIW03634.1 hypothetical protein TanjilG_22291 [Lupinus angustifolius]